MNKKLSVALSSVIASFFLTLMKLIVGIMTMSMGIISEAAHSLLDFGAALLTFFAVKIGDKPADPTHPFGHGKVESVSALIETGLLFITSFYIIYESIHRLFFKSIEVQATWYSFVVIGISIIIDISRSRALTKTAKETGSQALEADALHFSSDILSSFVVLIGLALVRLGFNGADAIAALGVAAFVMVAGYRLGKRTIDVLVDTAPAGITEKVNEIISGFEEILSVEKVRVRPAGPSVFIDITFFISRRLSLEKVQAVKDRVIAKIREQIPEADVVIHASPVKEDNETVIEALRVLSARHGLAIHNIAIEEINGKNHISYHVEVPGELTLAAAHDLTEKIEKEFWEEIDAEAKIDAHLEPLKADSKPGEAVLEAEQDKLEKKILAIAQKDQRIIDVHEIFFSKSGNGLTVTLHCHVPKDLTVEVVHQIATELEFSLKEELSGLSRVIVHTEPK